MMTTGRKEKQSKEAEMISLQYMAGQDQSRTEAS